MNFQALVMLAVGLVAGAEPVDESKVNRNDKNWPYYAKVEVQGCMMSFLREVRFGPTMCIQIDTRPKSTNYPLDISKLEGWTRDALAKLIGKDVRVKGDLEHMPYEIIEGEKTEGLVIVAKSLEVVPAKQPARKKR